MSSKKKKILSALLASSMLVSQVSVVAFAEATNPTADMLDFTLSDVTYDGTAKSISVSVKSEQIYSGTLSVAEVQYSTTNQETGEYPEGHTGAPTNVGKYYVYAKISSTDTGTYNTDYVVNLGSFEIKAKELSANDLEFTSGSTFTKTYDGTTDCDTVSAQIKAGVVGEEAVSIEGIATYDNANVNDATKITFTPTAIASGNYTLAASETIENSATITAAEISTIAVTGVDVPSVGSALDTEATAGDTTYTLSDVSWVPTGTDGKADYNTAYTASVTVSLTDSTNYKFADKVSATINGKTATVTAGEAGEKVISYTFDATAKEYAGYTKSPEAVENLKYTGKAQALVTAGEAEGGTVQYRLGDTGEFSNTIPTATAVGTYTVYYMVKGDENHSDTEPMQIPVTIAKATPTVTAPTVSAELAYGDKLSTATLSEGWSWTNGEEVPTVNNSGFTATKTVDDYENYDYAAFAAASEGKFTYAEDTHKLSATVNVTVNPKAIAIKVEDSSEDPFTYDGKPKTFKTVTVSYNDGVKDITLKASTEETPGDYTILYSNNTDVGDDKASYVIDPETKGNYTFTSFTRLFSIAQAEPIITVTESQTANKGTDAFVAPTADVDGAFEYEIGVQKYTESELKTYLSEQNAGDITINYTFKPTDSTNYAEKNGSISYKVVELTFYVGETAVGGENPAVTVKKDAPVYGDDWTDIIQVNVNGAKIGDTAAQEGATFTLDVSGKPNAGEQTYNVLFNGTIGGEKYTDIVVYTGTVDVAKKELTVEAGTLAITKEYDGTTDAATPTGELSVTGKVDSDDVTVTATAGAYSDSKVGSDYEITITLGLDGEKAANYTLNTDSLKLTGIITAKSITPTVDAIADQTYTGSAIEPTVVVKDGDKVLTENTDYTVEYSNNTDKGTATVTVKAVSGGNYSFTDKPVNFNITAATITPTVAAIAAQTFTGSAIEPVVTVKDGETPLVLGTDYTVEYKDNTNAGTATITISPVASSNYTFTEIEKTFTIKPKKVETLNVEVTGNYSYTGSAITPTFTVKDGETALAASDYVATITDNINAGTGKVTITAKSGGNYTFTETSANFTIAKASAPTVADTNAYYGVSETGEKTVALVLPNVGTIDYENSTVVITEGDNANGVITETVSISASGITFTLGENASNSGNTATITATIVSQNYDNITAKLVVTINEKKTPAKPTCILSFSESGGTYTATIEAVEGAEYSFDGTTWSATNTKSGIAPNTVVTAYIRIKATETANASPVASVTATTPALKAATPTITAGTTFTESQEVTISCTTEGAEIFYTTDGTAPSASNGTKYTGAFTITTTTTVKAIAIKSGYTNSDVVSATYTKKSTTPSNPGGSGGSGGGSSSGGSSSTSTPSIDGKETTWTDVAKDISKLTEDKTQTIDLNGSTTVPVEVVKAIATSNAEVTLKVDDVFSWTIDGSDIDAKDAKAASLSITKATVTGTSALRGTVGTGFSIKGTNVKSELNINFKATNAGKFANLFKKVDGKLVFVDNVKVDKNGAAIGLEVSEKGEYVVMLGKYSDRAGDMDNDGIMNTKDSLAILKDFLDIESGENPVVADINGDGYINAKDALEVLIAFLNLK